MSDTNIVVEIGRATRDGELKFLNSGIAVLNFSIAVNRSIPPKDGGEWKNEASFFDVQAWGKLAESKNKSIVKGKQLCIRGELRQDRWEQDGQARSRVYIVAESIQPLADPRSQGQAESATAAPNNGTARQGTAQPAAVLNVFPDDFPF